MSVNTKISFLKEKFLHIKFFFHDQFFKLTPLVRLNILAVFVGVAGGVGSWVFIMLTNLIFIVFYVFPRELLSGTIFFQFIWVPFLIVPALGGLLTGFITSKFSKESKGHGVPEVLEAVTLNNGKMSMKVPFVKIVASAATIGSGGSAGHEGPMVQIGAGFASMIGQILDLSPRELRTLVISGVCAGLSAAFNAPIGGALFGLEVIARGNPGSYFIPLIIASMIGTVVGHALIGTNPAFENFPPLKYQDPTLIPFYIILGLVLGILSIFWIKFFFKFEDLVESLLKKFKIPDALLPAIGGLFVGVILLITFLYAGDDWEKYTVMGHSSMPIEAVFEGTLTQGPVFSVLFVLIALFLLKMIATSMTIGTGGSGGVFSPTLFLGVMLGAIFGVALRDIFLIPNIDVAVFTLLGMAGLLAGTVRSPLTAIIMTAELTGDYFLTIPLMFTVVVSWLIAGKIQSEDIYTLKLSRRGVKIQERAEDILEGINVSEIMTPREKMITIDLKSRLESVLDIVQTTQHEGFPVFDQDQFVGVITLGDVQKALREHPKDWNVEDVLKDKQKHLICVDQNTSLAHVIEIMVRWDISRLPVVEKTESTNLNLIGWVTHHDITKAYMKNRVKEVLNELEDHVLSY